jgi:hypothetical protein
METGGSAEPLRVKAALELYGAPTSVVAEMVAIANQRRRRTPRPSYYEFVSPVFAEYVDLEREAAIVSSYQNEIVSGLLQTEKYARSLISGVERLVPKEDVEKRVALRLDRQKRLTGENALEFRCVLAESTLYNQIGGAAVLREQIQHLIDVSRTHDNVALRVMPFTTGTHPAVGGNLVVVSFRDPAGVARPELVYVENTLSFVLQEDPSEVDLAANVYEDVWQSALDPESSLGMMRRALARLRKS